MAGKRITEPDFPILKKIAVSGFKSIRDEQHIDINNLTILAGANSSGKSSMMQPLLLLKQTLEAPYDPGALLLNGPNVKFTNTDQLLSKFDKERASSFKITLFNAYELEYSKAQKIGFQIHSCSLIDKSGHKIKFPISANDDQNEILEFIARKFPNFKFNKTGKGKFEIMRNRSFVTEISWKEPGSSISFSIINEEKINIIERMIHLPSLRGNPERTYPVTAVGETFPGTFEAYTASTIFKWQTNGNIKEINRVTDDLKKLGLTWKVDAHKINDAQVELRVGRLLQAGKTGTQDLVNIADVGFGLSQTLPIITALHAAAPGQIVYLEQPEIHLHPRAQVAMAEVLAEAAKRGVCVIVETHSSLLILSLQALIAEQKLSPDLVSLNWFERDKSGATKVTQGQLDEAGRFGDWPVDFDDVELNLEGRFLNAVDKRMAI